MAIGSSAGDLIISVLALFVEKSTIGLGFNIILIIIINLKLKNKIKNKNNRHDCGK